MSGEAPIEDPNYYPDYRSKINLKPGAVTQVQEIDPYHVHPRHRRTIKPRAYQPLHNSFKPVPAGKSKARHKDSYRARRCNLINEADFLSKLAVKVFETGM